ncbi:MAG: glutathione S-transferase N-terminal domain-containing protein [Bacillota bacterium]|nr:glutathione S-transferase N-terminal domain-containing protein [Bacillota bacterium]
MKELKLYYMNFCPFCIKAKRFAEKHPELNVEFLNIKDEANHKALIEIGGKDQVPMLTVDGKPMYESGAIVKFLKEELKK